MIFFKKKRNQAESERKAREGANLQHMFFQLPAELRNRIYELVIPSGQVLVKRKIHNRARGWPGGLPSLLQVCRRWREELFPYFYGINTVTVVLEDLMMHPRSINRVQSCINLIPRDGTSCWREVKIESCARCFHEGFARQPNVDAKINREKGTVLCAPRYGQYLNKCCKSKAEDYSKRLQAQIRACHLQDGNRKLRREDFERLMRRMDESRRDWPKSGKRVIPRYYN